MLVGEEMDPLQEEPHKVYSPRHGMSNNNLLFIFPEKEQTQAGKGSPLARKINSLYGDKLPKNHPSDNPTVLDRTAGAKECSGCLDEVA